MRRVLRDTNTTGATSARRIMSVVRVSLYIIVVRKVYCSRRGLGHFVRGRGVEAHGSVAEG